MLFEQDCSELGIEIIAPEPGRDMRVFAVGAGNPVVQIWPELRGKIVGLLPRCEWALDMLLYGETLGEAEATIFVTIGGAWDGDWSHLQQQIETLACGIPVEVRAGKQIRSRINDQTPTDSRHNQTYEPSIDSGWTAYLDSPHFSKRKADQLKKITDIQPA